jgi:hypothetical protein
MYPSIENLLRIRDGEPIDADALAYVEADPSARAELRRLRDTQQALKDLPGFLPPAGVWERVIDTAETDAARRVRRSWQWPLRGAIAASVAVLAIVVITRAPETLGPFETGPATIVAESVPNNPMTRIVGTPSYASLVAESARLDRALGSITYRPTVMRGSTVSTITTFEDQIAVVDDRLMYADRLNLSALQRRALYQHRVDLMNGLFYVRYAQAQRSGY